MYVRMISEDDNESVGSRPVAQSGHLLLSHSGRFPVDLNVNVCCSGSSFPRQVSFGQKSNSSGASAQEGVPQRRCMGKDGMGCVAHEGEFEKTRLARSSLVFVLDARLKVLGGGTCGPCSHLVSEPQPVAARRFPCQKVPQHSIRSFSADQVLGCEMLWHFWDG